MKRLLTVLLTCVMLMGFSLTTVHAEESPKAEPVEVTSPKTGESDVLAYGMMTMCLCAGVVTVAFKKSR